MYKRVLLKISGEALQGEKQFGIDYNVLGQITQQIIDVYNEGIEVVVVVGAGNIWRYRDSKDSGIERSSSDSIGMMATIMNAIALQSSIEKAGVVCRVCSALQIPQVAEEYLRRKAVRHLEKKRIVICAGGTGNPYFTTDSAAALRGLELQCDVLLKGTNVDGVYDSDPATNPDAQFLKTLTLQEVLEKNIKVMDQAAISLCKEANLPIRVFNMQQPGNILKAAKGEDIGSLVQ
jgi:uridylate kinase